MLVAVPRESYPGEKRVALVPGSLPALAKAGVEVIVESAAGEAAGYPDELYTEAGAKFHIHRITNRANKVSRIANLEPEITQGRIQLNRRHQLLLGQLIQFPLGKHDDGPDALEMAMEASRQVLIPQGSNAVYLHVPPPTRWDV